MSHTGGSFMSIADHVGLPPASAWGRDQVQLIRSDWLLKITKECELSSDVQSIENYLLSKATARGFSVEFYVMDKKWPVTNSEIHSQMYQLWEKVVDKMLIHFNRYGFCVVKYVKRAKKLNGSDYVPVVLEPVVDYQLVRVKNAQFATEYYAVHSENYSFQRASKVSEIPLTRVFMHTEPTALGIPSSPMQRCLGDLQRIRGYWERHQMADYNTVYPKFIYEVDVPKEGPIPTGSTTGDLSDFSNKIERELHLKRNLESQQLVNIESRIIAEKYMDHEMKQSEDTEMDMAPSYTDGSIGFNYNYLYNADQLSHIKTTFRPEKRLPIGTRLSAHTPTSRPLNDLAKIIEMLKKNVVICNGLPPEVLLGTANKFSSNVELAQQTTISTILKLQRGLERSIALMYLDIYVDDHLEWITIYLNHIEEKIAAKAQKKTEVIKFDDVVPKDKKEKNKKEKDDNKPKKQTEDEDDTVSVKKKNSEPIVIKKTLPEGRRRPQKRLISDTTRDLFEKKVRVRVHFNSNPSRTIQELFMLYERDIINHENLQQLVLADSSISTTLAKTPEEIEKDKREREADELRMSKLTQQQQPTQTQQTQSDTPKESESQSKTKEDTKPKDKDKDEDKDKSTKDKKRKPESEKPSKGPKPKKRKKDTPKTKGNN